MNSTRTSIGFSDSLILHLKRNRVVSKRLNDWFWNLPTHDHHQRCDSSKWMVCPPASWFLQSSYNLTVHDFYVYALRPISPDHLLFDPIQTVFNFRQFYRSVKKVCIFLIGLWILLKNGHMKKVSNLIQVINDLL